jgi:hypothetical protein
MAESWNDSESWNTAVNHAAVSMRLRMKVQQGVVHGHNVEPNPARFAPSFSMVVVRSPRYLSMMSVGNLPPSRGWVASAGIPFRHTYRSLLAKVETNLEVQRALMRQADIRTTMGYGETPMEGRREANSKVARLILERRSSLWPAQKPENRAFAPGFLWVGFMG